MLLKPEMGPETVFQRAAYGFRGCAWVVSAHLFFAIVDG